MEKKFPNFKAIRKDSFNDFTEGTNIQVFLMDITKTKGEAKLLLDVKSVDEILDALKEVESKVDFKYNEVTVATVTYEQLVSRKKKYLEQMLIIREYLGDDFKEKASEFLENFEKNPKLQYEVYSSFIKNHSNGYECKLSK